MNGGKLRFGAETKACYDLSATGTITKDSGAKRQMNSLEIILPLRNPPAAFERTVDSLLEQTDKSFSVLISDNHSKNGTELINAGLERLRRAGFAAQRVRPPIELGRVEHWNWAHHASQADWLKPLFAGDWLEPHYVSEVRRALAANPACRYIFCNYIFHHGDTPPMPSASPWTGRFRAPAEMQRRVLSHGMQFGPPSAAAFEREAFVAVGGYPTALPICSDSLMFCTLAARFGVLGLAEPLCHFNIHDARFSTSLPGRRKDSLREALTYFGLLAYGAWSARLRVSVLDWVRLLLREVRSYLAAK
jgi:hypothetical protein